MDIISLLKMVKDNLALIAALIAGAAAIMEGLSKTVKPISALFKLVQVKWGQDTAGKVDALTNAVSALTEQVRCIQTDVCEIRSNVCENEMDRLSAELTKFYQIARAQKQIDDSEWGYLERVWEKYSVVLHGNHGMETKWNFIHEYYTRKGWEKPARTATKKGVS